MLDFLGEEIAEGKGLRVALGAAAVGVLLLTALASPQYGTTIG